MEKNELPCGATFAIIAGIALVVIFILNRPNNAAEWAAWVQAVGSIAAIWGAFKISDRAAERNRVMQIEAEKRERMRVENGYKEVVLNLSNQAASMAKLVTSSEPTVFVIAWHGYLKSTADACLKAFDALPLHDMGGSERIAIAFAIREEAQDFFGKLSQLPYNESLPALHTTLVREELPHLHANLKVFIEQFQRCYPSVV